MSVKLNQRQLGEFTLALGREMFDRMRAGRPRPYQAAWWQDRMLRQCMQDEWLKVQSFRFIDALPVLHDGVDIARHLREYFVHPDFVAPRHTPEGGSSNGAAHHHAANGHQHPRAAARAAQQVALAELDGARGRGFVRWISHALNFQRTDSLRAQMTAWLAWQSATTMAHQFIAGSSVREVATTIGRLRRRRQTFTLDVLGEATVSERECEAYQATYEDLLTNLPAQLEGGFDPLIDEADGQLLPRVNLSVKLSALFSQMDAIDPAGSQQRVLERLRPLLRLAMKQGAHLHVDMEHYAVKDLTLRICREVFAEPEFRDYPHFGVVLQAYLRDCERDAAELVDWCRTRGAPIWVRLVKGAYWDTETVLHDQQFWPWPVWSEKWESDACFERCTRLLLENHRVIKTALGSHNVRSLAHGMALQRLLNVPPTHFELQMLYGMGDPIKSAAVEMGQRCRIYTPYGELLPGMAYLIRRLLENTANESFLRHSFDENTTPAELLRDPVDVGRATQPTPRWPMLRFEDGEMLMDPFTNVPNVDFTREESRRQMQDALQHVRSQFGQEHPLVIGGERVVTGRWIDSLNPSHPREVVGRAALSGAAEAEQAVRVAGEAFKTWRRSAVQTRADCLLRMAEIIERRRFELSALMALECGKPWREADADVSEAVDFCNFYAKEALRKAENARRRDLPGETNELLYAPRGVVAVIAPWNFPLAILCGMTTAAVVTGNTVIMKPAEQASVIAARLMEIIEEADVPAGVVNYLPGEGHVVGDLLVRHPGVAMIVFTGSRAVGCQISKVAAEIFTAQPGLKRVVAEMGGKNAIIVDADADLDEAVKGTVASAFGYAGQKCSAASRVIVLEPIYDRFVERLVEAARSVQVGPADDPGSFVPPVIDAAAAENIRKMIDAGSREGRVALQTDVSALVRESGGYYVGPTIVADVSPRARIAQEEIFGPVLAVIRARNLDDAIDIFNNTDYALTGGIFSRSPAHIDRARVECECGNLYINRKITGALVDVQPFGGFKMSGIGSKAGGPDYLLQFVEPRNITENTLRRGFAPSDNAKV